MADQIEKCDINNALHWENTFRVKEECQENNFVDDKVHISKTTVNIDNAELPDRSLLGKMKQYGVPATLNNIKTELPFLKVQHDVIYDNLKLEEGTSTDGIKIEFGIRLLYCEDCHAYCEDYCTECGMLVHILNKNCLTKAIYGSREDLPSNNILEFRDCFGQFRIFALKVIPVGVKFGPFTGLKKTEFSWKIKGGKFAVNEAKSKYLNWMQYINSARNISEHNLLIFQYEHNLYYQSTCQIQAGEELLVYFGEEYEDCLNRNVEMDFIPTVEHVLKDSFACTYCCLGFSSKSYLAKHKAICPGNVGGEFSIDGLVQCPSCKIHMDSTEYTIQHMAYCCEKSDRKCILPTTGNGTGQINGPKTRPRQMYKCRQCKYRTKYKGDIKNHANMHLEVKMYKCGVCCRRFKIEEVLKLHVENAHTCAGAKVDLEHSTGLYMNVHVKVEHAYWQDEMKQFKCSLCEFRTIYKTSLRRHTKAKHLKEFKYKCDRCKYKTNFKPSLKAHIRTRHLKEFKYTCKTCEYKSHWSSALKRHVNTRHSKELKYNCDSCNYTTNVKCNLRRHTQNRHLQVFKYQCHTCDYKSNVKSNLRAHIDTKHLKEFKYKCDACDYKANLKSNVRAHIEARHLKELKYKCNSCDYKSHWKSALKRHVNTRHAQQLRYNCDSCSYTTNVKFQLKRHIDTRHLKELKFKCDTCDYRTYLKSTLKTHIETKHLKEFKYKCDRCDYKTNWDGNLKQHIEGRHLKEFKYVCNICQYKSNWKSDLKRHIEAGHSQEFNYKCDKCNYITNRKGSLKTHIEAIHLNELKYKCDTCDYRTNLNSSLKRHVQAKHLKEFKYKCDRCDYKTYLKGNLKAHIEAKHLKILKYECNICRYKSHLKSNLKAHVETRHF